MNSYEIAILFDPGLEVDLEQATKKVEKIFNDNGGTVTNVDNWGKKKLAYQIKKHDSAVYVFYTVDLKAIAKAEAEKARKAEQAAKRGDSEDKEEEEE